MLFRAAGTALVFSVVFTLAALLVFGYIKGRFTGARPIRSAIQTALIGGLAAAVVFALAKAISLCGGQPMNANDKHHRAILQDIAHRAMLERGLLPDFSPQALAELDRIQAPAWL